MNPMEQNPRGMMINMVILLGEVGWWMHESCVDFIYGEYCIVLIC